MLRQKWRPSSQRAPDKCGRASLIRCSHETAEKQRVGGASGAPPGAGAEPIMSHAALLVQVRPMPVGHCRRISQNLRLILC